MLALNRLKKFVCLGAQGVTLDMETFSESAETGHTRVVDALSKVRHIDLVYMRAGGVRGVRRRDSPTDTEITFYGDKSRFHLPFPTWKQAELARLH